MHIATKSKKGDVRSVTDSVTLTAECEEEKYILATIVRQFFEMGNGRMRLDLPIQWEEDSIPKELIRA